MLFEKLNVLKEEDFAFFRIPFESGRQNPKTLSKGLILIILMQFVMGLVIFVIADPEVRPGYYKVPLIIIQYLFTLLLVLFATIYIFPRVYLNNQHMQLLAANLLFINFIGIFPLSAALFGVVRTVEVSERSFFSLAVIVIVSGIILFLASLYRLYKSIEKGKYRRDSDKVDFEKELQKDREVFSKLPEVVIAGLGILFIVNYLTSVMGADFEVTLITLISFMLFYIGMIMFARAIISVYCKNRFTSFNFNEEGELNPIGSGDKLSDTIS